MVCCHFIHVYLRIYVATFMFHVQYHIAAPMTRTFPIDCVRFTISWSFLSIFKVDASLGVANYIHAKGVYVLSRFGSGIYNKHYYWQCLLIESNSVKGSDRLRIWLKIATMKGLVSYCESALVSIFCDGDHTIRGCLFKKWNLSPQILSNLSKNVSHYYGMAILFLSLMLYISSSGRSQKVLY